MVDKPKRILWADDEIQLLRPHILFLNQHNYQVTPVTNGDDAIVMVRQQAFDLILLDEMMPGRDGLSTLTEIKNINANVPVIMITKNEEESLMDEAIGKRIDDYLTKPVNPSQILSACKRILDSRKIRRGQITQDYVTQFNQIRSLLTMGPNWEEWIQIYLHMLEWDLQLEQFRDVGLRQIQVDQKRECNAAFGRFIEQNYPLWLQGENSPPLSVDVISRWVMPLLEQGEQVYFIVVDCMRLDQWLAIEPMLADYYTINRDYHYAILPTATPYARNALFSGLFPLELVQRHPDLWGQEDRDDQSRNRHERQLLDRQLARLGLKLHPEPKYAKILDVEEAWDVAKRITNYFDAPMTSMVFNFVDILTHGRSESEILQEIAPDEAGFRSLTKSWFTHSALFQILQRLARRPCTVVLTSDHGAVLGIRATKVLGDRQTSTNLRYKYGNYLNCNTKHAIFIKDPKTYKLPAYTPATNYIIAREDYYFVYPNRFHEFQKCYQNSFQHGGVALEEMIIPVVVMRGKRA